jgi:ribosomal protein L23
MQIIKYKISAFYAYWEGQDELPEKPFKGEDEPGVIFGRSADRWVRKLRNNSQRFSEFIYSINMSKKGMPRASKTEIKAAEQKLFESLTTETERKESWFPNLKWADMEDTHETPYEINVNKHDIKEKIVELIEEIFTQTTLEEVISRPFTPSTNANYNRSKGKFGAYGHLVSEGILSDDESFFPKLEKVKEPEERTNTK